MIVFLDTETGGLDPHVHPLIEVAWSMGGGPVKSLVLAHDISQADPEALKINGYEERELGDQNKWASNDEVLDLLNDLNGNTICGANPAFDHGFLKAYFRSAPWKYRLLDIEAYASGVLGWDGDPVTSLRNLSDYLRAQGYDIPEPDHTAAGDVRTLIGCYRTVRELQAKRDALSL